MLIFAVPSLAEPFFRSLHSDEKRHVDFIKNVRLMQRDKNMNRVLERANASWTEFSRKAAYGICHRKVSEKRNLAARELWKDYIDGLQLDVGVRSWSKLEWCVEECDSLVQGLAITALPRFLHSELYDDWQEAAEALEPQDPGGDVAAALLSTLGRLRRRLPANMEAWLGVLVSMAETLQLCVAVSDMAAPGAPMVYVNGEFCRMTGYAFDECVGRNCRFLQGPETETDAVEILRESLAARKGAHFELRAGREASAMAQRRELASLGRLLQSLPVKGREGHDGHPTHFAKRVNYLYTRAVWLAHPAACLDAILRAPGTVGDHVRDYIDGSCAGLAALLRNVLFAADGALRLLATATPKSKLLDHRDGHSGHRDDPEPPVHASSLGDDDLACFALFCDEAPMSRALSVGSSGRGPRPSYAAPEQPLWAAGRTLAESCRDHVAKLLLESGRRAFVEKSIRATKACVQECLVDLVLAPLLASKVGLEIIQELCDGRRVADAGAGRRPPPRGRFAVKRSGTWLDMVPAVAHEVGDDIGVCCSDLRAPGLPLAYVSAAVDSLTTLYCYDRSGDRFKCMVVLVTLRDALGEPAYTLGFQRAPLALACWLTVEGFRARDDRAKGGARWVATLDAVLDGAKPRRALLKWAEAAEDCTIVARGLLRFVLDVDAALACKERQDKIDKLRELLLRMHGNALHYFSSLEIPMGSMARMNLDQALDLRRDVADFVPTALHACLRKGRPGKRVLLPRATTDGADASAEEACAPGLCLCQPAAAVPDLSAVLLCGLDPETLRDDLHVASTLCGLLAAPPSRHAADRRLEAARAAPRRGRRRALWAKVSNRKLDRHLKEADNSAVPLQARFGGNAGLLALPNALTTSLANSHRVTATGAKSPRLMDAGLADRDSRRKWCSYGYEKQRKLLFTAMADVKAEGDKALIQQYEDDLLSAQDLSTLLDSHRHEVKELHPDMVEHGRLTRELEHVRTRSARAKLALKKKQDWEVNNMTRKHERERDDMQQRHLDEAQTFIDKTPGVETAAGLPPKRDNEVRHNARVVEAMLAQHTNAREALESKQGAARETALERMRIAERRGRVYRLPGMEDDDPALRKKQSPHAAHQQAIVTHYVNKHKTAVQHSRNY
ncbi:hypothetical protein JL721_8555 [Aureococcus anophagefferens]|nr:hypothetical protein JL721_8555 [Aureococcus anophagefferens]